MWQLWFVGEIVNSNKKNPIGFVFNTGKCAFILMASSWAERFSSCSTVSWWTLYYKESRYAVISWLCARTHSVSFMLICTKHAACLYFNCFPCDEDSLNWTVDGLNCKCNPFECSFYLFHFEFFIYNCSKASTADTRLPEGTSSFDPVELLISSTFTWLWSTRWNKVA